MAVKARQVSVAATGSGTQLSSAAPSYHGSSVAIWCSSDVKVGGADVATSFAVLPANTPFAPDLSSGEPLFALAVSGSATVNVFETGV